MSTIYIPQEQSQREYTCTFSRKGVTVKLLFRWLKGDKIWITDIFLGNGSEPFLRGLPAELDVNMIKGYEVYFPFKSIAVTDTLNSTELIDNYIDFGDRIQVYVGD